MQASASGAMPMQDPLGAKLPSLDGVKQGAQNAFKSLSESV